MMLTGYLDRFSYRPGEKVPVRLSTDAPRLTLDLVRLLHGDANPNGPGFRTEVVGEVSARQVPGRLQPIAQGSYVYVGGVVDEPVHSLDLAATLWATTPAAGRIQGILSVVTGAGASVAGLALDADGHPVVGAGEEVLARAKFALRERRWYRLRARVGPRGAELCVVACTPLPEERGGAEARGEGTTLDGASDVLIAALSRREGATRPVAQGLYNGKIEAPEVRVGEETKARWAFERMEEPALAWDISGRNRHGDVINTPARGVTGANWTGEVEDFRLAPDQYGAIHFHEDDLTDAGWSIDGEVPLPDDLASGVYAVRVQRGDGAEVSVAGAPGRVDHIPFAVRPPAGHDRSRVAFLLPTYTYVAYANERLLHRLDYEGAGITDHPIEPGYHDRFLAEHAEFGSSLYDHHTDGSGVCYSSHLRPIPNLRPDYRMWLQNAPRHLSADLYVVAFLEHLGIAWDAVTDHDLDREGYAAIDGYDVVITGSHPEYCSGRMLDALKEHVEDRGRIMYLGGNGFYWVTSANPRTPEILEVRRSAGIRTWEVAPGEHHHATSGERGGLWRWRGRAPNRLFGIGMCSQGWDRKAPPYIRTEASYEPAWSWIFDGIDDHELGDFGLIMDGASGDELDRFDPALGSPPNTVVLATSARHSDYYQLAVEDVLMLTPGLGGSECDDVRSDMVLVEHASGGAVFSVGSICYTGCLPCNGFVNNIAQLTRNVLRGFLEATAERRRAARASSNA